MMLLAHCRVKCFITEFSLQNLFKILAGILQIAEKKLRYGVFSAKSLHNPCWNPSNYREKASSRRFLCKTSSQSLLKAFKLQRKGLVMEFSLQNRITPHDEALKIADAKATSAVKSK